MSNSNEDFKSMSAIHETWPDLFSPDLWVRYEATRKFVESGESYSSPAWEECKLAANGWTMLIGPSPGAQKGKNKAPSEDEQKQSADNERNRIPIPGALRVGLDIGRIAFDDETKSTRSNHWNKLTIAAAMGNQECAFALTTLCNLDFLNSKLQTGTPGDRLKRGRSDVFETMQMTRPRLILPLTVKVYWLMREFLEKQHLVTFKTKANSLTPSCETVVFRIPGCDWDSLMIKSPKHPSWCPSNKSLELLKDLVKSETESA